MLVRSVWAMAMALAAAACSDAPSGGESAAAGGPGAGSGDCPPPEEQPTARPDDVMSFARRLRRVKLVLEGTTPTPEQYEALAALPDDDAREAAIDEAIDEGLEAPAFYEKLVELGHDWIKNAAYRAGASGDAYQGNMSGSLALCGDGTIHAGAYYRPDEIPGYGDTSKVCDDQDIDGNPLAQPRTEKQIEPWWAPGTQVAVLGSAGGNVTEVTDDDGNPVDCGVAAGGYYDPALPAGCSCGPNLVWCWPYMGLSGGHQQAVSAWDEPARLLAHIGWHDRPLSDLVLGNYSVADNMLRALYVRMGRQNAENAAQLDGNTSWWKPDVGDEPRDPLHPDAGDADAWREFVVATLQPDLLSLSDGDAPSGSMDRSYEYDPRTTTAPPEGWPAAGVLTMMGYLSSFERERPRAARTLEIFACKDFSPPDPTLAFPEYDGDPATTGVCLHCHQTIDSVALVFKRWDFTPAFSYYVPWPMIGGLGPWKITPEQLSQEYPYGVVPYARWAQSWLPGTVMTPVTEADIVKNPGAVFLDTLPKGEKLFGAEADGTMGPLGLAKVLVASGEFDRCAAQRLYERFVGRRLDKGTEALYIQKLADKLVEGNRELRPFVRWLLKTDEIRRGL